MAAEGGEQQAGAGGPRSCASLHILAHRMRVILGIGLRPTSASEKLSSAKEALLTEMYRAGTYIGWVGHRNLGDEAMWRVCRQRFPQIHWFALKRFGESLRRAVSRTRHEASAVFLPRAQTAPPGAVSYGSSHEVGLLGGGTLINRNNTYLNSYKQLRQRTGKPVPVFGTGVASTELWSALPEWSDRRQEWVGLLAELPVVGVRGPLSEASLKEAGARNVVIAGDPAVMFHMQEMERPQPAAFPGPLRIGINCGFARGLLWGSNALIDETLTSVARQLARQGHEVELLSVWRHDTESCYRVARQAGLSQHAVAPPLLSPREFLDRVRTLDVVIALKLHTAVLAAAANVPFVMLEYRPKCLDFALSLGWERFCIRTSELTAPKVLQAVLEIAATRSALRADLCRKMCQLCQRFENYCAMIEPLLMGSAAVRATWAASAAGILPPDQK